MSAQPPVHGETAFETVSESYLLANGYVKVDKSGFGRARAIFPEVMLGFIRETQPKEWARLETLHGSKTGEQVLTDLCKWMDTYGSLATLRHGFKCYGRTLLVAEKYQTGFDQPLLHTMYVDKRLAGIQAVQTLSRLNRMHPLKEDTFVLDFVNDRQEIQEAFKQFYEGAEMGEEVDPARMYEIKADLDGSGIYLAEEVERFCAIFFKPRERQSPADHQTMNAALDPAVDRFRALQENDEDEAELWRSKLQAFRNLYSFLSQVIPYQDSDLERLYTFLRHLSAKLPKRSSGPRYNFDDEVRLEYYRLQKISEGSISLKEGYVKPLDGPSEVGSGMVREEMVSLLRLIDVVNERFGTDFTAADQLFFDQIIEAALADESLRQAAKVNPVDKFSLVFNNLLETLFVERMDQNEEIFARFMNEEPFRKVVAAWMASEVYRKLERGAGSFVRDPGTQEREKQASLQEERGEG